MARTFNKDMDIFATLMGAIRAFNKTEVSCHLLQAYKTYYIDRSKTAIKHWPKKYILLKEK